MLFIFTFLGLMTGLLSKHYAARRHHWWLWLAYLLSVPIMIVLPGKFFDHYYQLWLPVLSIGTGSAIVLLTRFGAYQTIFRTIILALVAAWLVYIQMPFFSLSPQAVSYYKYKTDVFISVERIGKSLQTLLLPHETLFQWGEDSGVFFYSQRRAASRFFSFKPLILGKYREKYTQAALAELQSHPPEVVIMARDYLYPIHADKLFKWIFSHYVPAPDNHKRHAHFQFLIRKNGALMRRMREAT